MKTIIAIVLILICSVSSQAQDKAQANSGFWVVESNKNQPSVQIIRFYSDDSKLIYEETINTKLNLKREKIRVALNQLANKFCENKDDSNNRKLIELAFNLKR
jgi:hypothetical protein